MKSIKQNEKIMTRKSKNKLSRGLWIIFGLISLGIGTIGIVVPFLPSFPFYMFTLFAFAKSSDRLHDWFLQTNLYKNHLESYAKRRAMTRGTKLRVICSVTLVMAFGAYFMREKPAGLICLACVWLFHVIYFVFFVKSEIKGEYKEGTDNSSNY